MPSEDLHGRLMEPAGVRPYLAIPTLASWKGDVVSAKQRLQQFRVEDQRNAIAKHAEQFQYGSKVNPSAQASRSQLKQLGFVSAVAAQHPQTHPQHVPQQPVGRVAGNLTDPYVIDAAIERYQAGTLQAGEPNDQISKAIHGRLLVDIYTVTGQFMGAISRNLKLRTDNDCALFPFYRALHWAAADAFGKVFGIDGNEIDVYLRQQLIVMSKHGVDVDASRANQKLHVDASGNSVPQLCYLTDEEALACRLHISDGKFMIINAQGALEPFDCSGPEYKATSKTKTKTPNTAYQGTERNGNLGVAGFAMGLNRHIYARKHSLYAGPKGSFYHSAYLEGREVLCTGCLTVVNGELTYINNSSGHYQPQPKQLALVLQALQSQGIDIGKVLVEYESATTGNRPLFHKHGTDFLQAYIVKGAGFDNILASTQALADKRAELNNCANRIRAALREYEARSKRKFTWQSAKSTRAKTRLLGIGQDDETLVKEVGFTLYPYLLTDWPSLKPIASPLGTGPADQYQRGDTSELLTRLVAAFSDYLGPPTR